MVASLGIGSGIDLGGLIQQIVTAERTGKERRFNVREFDFQAKISAYGSLKSSLSQVESSLSVFKDLEPGNAISVTGGGDGTIGAAVDDTATIGSYTVSVSQLADANSLASNPFASSTTTVGTGSITFNFGTTVYDSNTDIYTSFTANTALSSFTVNITSGNDSLEDIRDAVNDANGGVNATIINDTSGSRLIFTSENSGVNGSLEVTVADDLTDNIDLTGLSQLAFNSSATNLQQSKAGVDANLLINGLSITSSDNEVDDAISGVTLSLQSLITEDATVTVSNNKSAISSALGAFASSVNEFRSLESQLSAFDLDSGVRGVLLGDALLRGVNATINNGIIGRAGGKPGVESLIDLGLSSDSTNQLKLDSSKLDAALDKNYGAVIDLLNDVGRDLGQSVTAYSGSDGIIDGKTDGLDRSLDLIGEQRVSLNERLTAMEARLTKQFTGLDLLLSQLTSTSEFLSLQLANISNITSRKK